MIDIDDKNRRILRELARGRADPATSRLAERVALSPSATLRRVQALEAAGVIRGYRVVTDPAKLGVGFVAYLAVGPEIPTPSPKQMAFERAMAAFGRGARVP